MPVYNPGGGSVVDESLGSFLDVAAIRDVHPTAPAGYFAVAVDTGHTWVWVDPAGWTDTGTAYFTPGVAGPQGGQGAQGPQGVKGDTGPAGPQGIRGLTGSSGPQGAQGPQGEVGPEGPQGLKGGTGSAGAQGVQGPAGPQGLPGAAGPQGPQGIQGLKGDTGSAGAAGATGPAGSSAPATIFSYSVDGSTLWHATWSAEDKYLRSSVDGGATWSGAMLFASGPKGDTGAQGVQGLKGDTGATGSTGPQGIQGLKGDTGAQGPQGVPGLKGDTGATGPAGAQGVQGVKGDAGAAGPAVAIQYSVAGVEWHDAFAAGDVYIRMSRDGGATWSGAIPVSIGPQGPQGVQGLKGDTGVQGLKGDTGAAGAQGVQGLKGDTGAQGVQGVQGPAGPDGADGVQGLTGDSVSLQYAVDGSTAWHSTWAQGDLYVQVKVGSGSWSAAIRFVGQDGTGGSTGPTTEYLLPLPAAATFAARWAAMPAQYKPAGWSMFGADDPAADLANLSFTAAATSMIIAHNSGRMVTALSITYQASVSPYQWKNFVNVAGDWVTNSSKSQTGVKGISGISAASAMTLLVRMA